ncbi:MAG: glutamate decarboxylase [Firmicutes bacterium]|nr:glutamate decarboxylase [Bacillota bacterium]
MWTVVYIAPNREAAEAIKKALAREGILASIRPVGLSATGAGNFEVLVSEAEAEEAHELVSMTLRDYGE